MKTSEVLNKSADLLKKRGWRQHKPAPPVAGSGLCVSNAISDVLGYNFEDMAPWHALMRHLGFDPKADDISRIFRWNDTPGRTASEVIEVLRACALIEEAREEAALVQTEEKFEEFAHAVPASRP